MRTDLYNKEVPFRIVVLSFLAVQILVSVACQRANINHADAVRSAVAAHINSRGDLSLSSLEITVRNVTFAGDRCQAEVLFVPQGQGPESGMAMQYELERDGDIWKVIPKASSGHSLPAQPEIPSATAPALPSGHPAVEPWDGAAH